LNSLKEMYSSTGKVKHSVVVTI